MNNSSVEEAQRYHEATKLRPEQDEVHERKSERSKKYVGLPVTPLDRSSTMPAVAALDALANTEFDEEIAVDITRLGQILRPAAHYILHRQAPEQNTCELDVYVVSSDLPGLSGGVYHLDPLTFELSRLRDGDYRPDLVAAAGDNQSLAAAPATLILSAALAGSYRSILTDTGRILADILVAASAAKLAASAEMSFVDALVNRLLGLDGASAAALCLIPLGRSLDWAEHVGERVLPALSPGVEPDHRTASDDPNPDPKTVKIHYASSLLCNEETRPLRGPCSRPGPAEPDDIRLDFTMRQSRALSELLQGAPQSGRTGKKVDLQDLVTVLHHATLDLPADFLEGPDTSLVDLYLVAHRVNGLATGLYAVRPTTRGMRRIRTGSLEADLQKGVAAYAECHRAAAHVILACDFDPVLQRFGNRGYRLALVEAGVTAGRIGLAAQSIGLGGPMLRFFDDEMTRFLSPHADGSAVILALALG